MTGKNGKEELERSSTYKYQDDDMKKKAKEELDEWGEKRRENQREEWGKSGTNVDHLSSHTEQSLFL